MVSHWEDDLFEAVNKLNIENGQEATPQESLKDARTQKPPRGSAPQTYSDGIPFLKQVNLSNETRTRTEERSKTRRIQGCPF